MRVLHIIHNLDRAGAQTSLASLLRGLSTQGGTHTVFAWKRSGPVAKSIETAGIEVITGPGRALPAIRQVASLISARQIDVVHAHMEDAASIAFAATRVRPRPYVVTFHDGTRLLPQLPFAKRLARTAAIRRAARGADAAIAVREGLEELIVGTLGVRNDRFITLPACVVVPSEEDVSEAISERSAKDDPLSVLSVGRHVGLKRHDLFVEALRILGQRGVPVRGVILGDGPLLEKNRALMVKVAPPASVEMPGATDDVAAQLRVADVLVNTSEYEGTSMAILEAMSWGIPVVASEVPGNRELVRAGVNGFTFPMEDPAALADAIIDAAAAPEPLRAAARQLVIERYSADTLAREHLRLYSRAAGREKHHAQELHA